MADQETAAAPAAEPAAPATAQETTDAKVKELAHAMDKMGLKTRTPSNMKYHPAKQAGEIDSAAAAANESTAQTTGETGGPKPPATPKPKSPHEAPSDLTQRKLSDGFAKLVRREKEVAHRDRQIAEKQAAIQAQLGNFKQQQVELAKAREAWSAEQQAKLEELTILDQDPAEWLERYAKRKGTTRQAVYDRLLSRVLNDGKPLPEHLAEDAKAELGSVKSELEKMKAEHSAKFEELKKQQEEERAAEAKRAAETAQLQREQQNFIHHVREEAADQYPLLSQEDPVKAAHLAVQIAIATVRSNGGKGVTVKQVAAHMEEQLRYAKWREEQAQAASTPAVPKPAKPAQPAAKPKAADTAASVAPTQSEATATTTAGATPDDGGAKPGMRNPKSNGLRSASGPKTITNQLAVRQSARATLPAPKNDNERLKRALSMWGKGGAP